MNDYTALGQFLNTAAREISAYQSSADGRPAALTEWIASSLLQKAIRRNRLHAATSAGRYLLATKGKTLFRRLNAICAEDIGLADIPTFGVVAACLSSAKARRDLGGDQKVVDYLIARMCSAPKSRAADDLLMSVERWAGLNHDRAGFHHASDDKLRRIILGCPSLDRRALALWYLVGTKRCPSDHLPTRAGNPELALSTLSEVGVAPTLLQISKANFTKTSTMLPLFVALLSLENDVVQTGSVNDPTPVECQIDGVPSWALDMYTRPGRASLQRLLREDAGMTSWSAAHWPKTGRVELAGELLFRLEGQCLQRRTAGSLGETLRRRWENECSGLAPVVVMEGLDLLRNAMPVLNTIRAEILMEGLV